MLFIKIFRTALFYFLIGSKLYAQAPEYANKEAFAEKIYLQLTDQKFHNDETIWFKVIALDAAFHSPKRSSGVLYIELINSKNEILDSKLLKVVNGIASGSIELFNSYQPGNYLLRAYTKWNENFGQKFITYREIEILDKRYNTSLYTLRYENHPKNKETVSGAINPQFIDENHDDKLKISVRTVDDSTSFKVKKNDDGEFLFSYDIQGINKPHEISVETSNRERYNAKLYPEAYLDLSFFPESGRMVEGLDSRVAFKAINADGKGCGIRGKVVNENNETVALIESNPLGMGSFNLRSTKIESQYTALITIEGEDTQYAFKLPQVYKYGYKLRIEKIKGRIVIEAKTNLKEDVDIVLKGISRGFNYCTLTKKTSNGAYIFVIPEDHLPYGIIQFQLLTGKDVVSQRVFFNTLPDREIDLDVSGLSETYKKRDKIQIVLKSSSFAGDPVPSNNSVYVRQIRDSIKPSTRQENILSYFLLSSDLRGKIENPAYYFKGNNIEEIDNLLLTQGWTLYKYTSKIDKFKYSKELGLSVSGLVTNRKGKPKMDSVDVTLLTLDKNKDVYNYRIKSHGNFRLNLEDIYGKKVPLLYEISSDEETYNNPFKFIFDKMNHPEIIYDLRNIYIIDNIENDTFQPQSDPAESNRIRNGDDLFDKDATFLDEVVIDANNMTPIRKKVIERYGSPDVIIDEKSLMNSKQKYAYGLFSVIRDFYPDKIRILETYDGTLFPSVFGENATLILIDNLPVKIDNYHLLKFIPTEEVTSFEIIYTAKNFSRLYQIVYPGSHQFIPIYGAIVAIYTKKRGGLFSAVDSFKGDSNSITIPAFATEKEFYIPRYDHKENRSDDFPDYRNLVFWKPKLKSNENGLSNIEFYHGDDTGLFQIIIESIGESGELSYKELYYRVE